MSTSTRKKIAYSRMRDFPYVNKIIPQLLEKSFPDYDVEIIEVIDIFKRRKHLILINGLFMLKEYGLDLLLRRRKLWHSFFGTTYFFKKVKDLVAERVAKGDYVFTFQVQSLFDGSTPDLPHFLYTDHTHLENLNYSNFDAHQFRSKAWLRLETNLYHRATINFVRSSNIVASFINHYGCDPDQVACIYVGSNANVSDIHMDNVDYTNKNILFVGMDWERKGGPELVEAFKSVLKVHPDATLTIVGSAPPLDVPNVRVMGRVPLEQVNKFYEKASIFCLPTRLEPFGVVFVEALQHSLPIVATNTAAIPDFVAPGENGYLVEVGSVQPLADALIDLLSDPEKCRRFGQKSLQLAQDKYNWERVSDRLRDYITPKLREAGKL